MCVCVCVCWEKKGKTLCHCQTALPLCAHGQTALSVVRCSLCLPSSHISHQDTDSNKYSPSWKGKKKIKRPTVCHVCICSRGVFFCVLRSEPALGLYSLRPSTAASLSASIIIFGLKNKLHHFKPQLGRFFFFWVARSRHAHAHTHADTTADNIWNGKAITGRFWLA